MSKKFKNTKVSAAQVIETTARDVKLPTKTTNVTKLPQVYKPAIAERAMTGDERVRNERYKGSVLMTTLAWMLSHKRPHDSASERNTLGYILLNLPKRTKWTFDATGNLHVDARERFEDGEMVRSRTLFTAHVDTVHSTEGFNKIRMTESVWYAHGSQLGADDGAGIAMLMHMMHNGIAGYYLFTVGEERGGVGAKAVSDDKTLLAKFDRAIAFDRRDTTSVISHQGWGRCASDAFCEALSAQLCDQGMLYMPDDTGVYTDTAEFTDDIAECTNLSIGYAREHSHEEALDIPHVQMLADAVLNVQWDALPVVRTPGDSDIPLWDNEWSSTFKSQHDAIGHTSYDGSAFYFDDLAEELSEALEDFLKGNPRALRVVLASEVDHWYNGRSRDDLLDEVDERLLGLDDDVTHAVLDALKAGSGGYETTSDLWDMLGGVAGVPHAK